MALIHKNTHFCVVWGVSSQDHTRDLYVIWVLTQKNTGDCCIGR